MVIEEKFYIYRDLRVESIQYLQYYKAYLGLQIIITKTFFRLFCSVQKNYKNKENFGTERLCGIIIRSSNVSENMELRIVVSVAQSFNHFPIKKMS